MPNCVTVSFGGLLFDLVNNFLTLNFIIRELFYKTYQYPLWKNKQKYYWNSVFYIITINHIYRHDMIILFQVGQYIQFYPY